VDADVSRNALDRIRRFNPSFTLAFFKNSTDSVSLLSVEGLIEYMNPNGLALLGFERSDEIAGLRWDMLWPVGTRGKVLAAITQAADGKTARYCSTLGYLNAPEIRSAITLTPLISPQGEVDALLAVIRAQ
jgi:PAS domain-containing protein